MFLGCRRWRHSCDSFRSRWRLQPWMQVLHAPAATAAAVPAAACLAAAPRPRACTQPAMLPLLLALAAAVQGQISTAAHRVVDNHSSSSNSSNTSAALSSCATALAPPAAPPALPVGPAAAQQRTRTTVPSASMPWAFRLMVTHTAQPLRTCRRSCSSACRRSRRG